MGPGTIDAILRLIGPLALERDGVAVPLPSSRKARALLAYLALSPRAVSRSHLCALLWDAAADPRGELRWCLSRLRALLEGPGLARVVTAGDTVALELGAMRVDVLELERAASDAGASAAPEAWFVGELLEGLALEESTPFDAWLASRRRWLHDLQTGLVARVLARTPDDGAAAWIERALRLAPFDVDLHGRLLGTLARAGRLAEGDAHVAAAAVAFVADGLDAAPLRDAWRRARATPSPNAAPPTHADTTAVPGAFAGASGPARPSRRASVAVMPFVGPGPLDDARDGLADALVHDVIARLARLRSLFVIAQGTMFALRERRVAADEVGALLGVDYVVAGTLRRRTGRLSASVELVEARGGRVVWTEDLDAPAADALGVLESIGDRIVASVDGEIEANERSRAMLAPPSSLDAWSAHHRGLWHMYRFEATANRVARGFFETAVRLDPTFSRAHAGLSFTHFQEVFQGWGDRASHVEHAYACAARALMADDRDPAAHWAMGRALWLRGGHGAALPELERAVALSPNFAIGHYTLAFVHSQTGDAATAIAASDHSRMLSPFDPMLFGMLGARAMALVRLGRYDEAADWGVKAAARPNAHAHIHGIAAYALAMAGRLGEARERLDSIRRGAPGYGVEDFLGAMRFADDGERAFREAARRLEGR